MNITSIGTNYTPSLNKLPNFRGVIELTTYDGKQGDLEGGDSPSIYYYDVKGIYRPFPGESKKYSKAVMKEFNGSHEGSEVHEHMKKNTKNRKKKEVLFTNYYTTWYDCTCELGKPLTPEELKKYDINNDKGTFIIYPDGKKEKFTKDTFHKAKTLIFN